jgi:hypothetical protein
MVAAVTAGSVTAAASPAAALASFSVSVSGNCGYQRSQLCSAYAQSVVGVGTGSSVTVSCTAASTRRVQATIVQCYIVGNSGDVHWAPAALTQGQVSTMAHTFDAWSLTSNAYRICTGAGVFDVTYHGPSNFICGSVI